ncbi:MAG: type III toxin-antitoxin system ToxN/AbiQ family toxin [Oscillospiraceae bacterium]|nr:type III toxin-antitoxin system ToxN/AbiQ family toxin [Oscillospiraceae bacterium]
MLSLYKPNIEYCEYLRTHDPRIAKVSDDKKRRPFIGVLLIVNEMHYLAPMTTPKPKHKKMKNQIDFLKINGGEYGAINFNNMMPVSEPFFDKIDLKITKQDSIDEIKYKTP